MAVIMAVIMALSNEYVSPKKWENWKDAPKKLEKTAETHQKIVKKMRNSSKNDETNWDTPQKIGKTKGETASKKLGKMEKLP